MPETNNAINLLVQLGVDTNSSKANLNDQIERLSTQLNNLDLKIDIDKNAIKALQDLSNIDLKGLSDSIKGSRQGISGLGDEAQGTGNEIKKNFSDVQRSLDATFNHLSKDFQQAMKKGITEVSELQSAFKGMEASFKMDYEVIGQDSTGQQIKRVKAIEASFKNLQGQIEKVKFNNSSAIDMGNGQLQNLWIPENTSKVIDSQMKQMESSITNAVIKSQQELNKLVRTGEITEQQFYDLSNAANKIAHPNSIQLYNQRLTETLNNNKQITAQKKEQLAIEERIRKLQNTITSAQLRDPKGLGSNTEISGMLSALKDINPASEGAAKAVKNVSDNFDQMKAKATQAGRESMSIMESFRVAMEKFPIWMAASTAFFGTVRSVKDAVDQIIQIDSQLTTLRRVSGGSDTDINKVLEESVRLAGQLGNQISDINDGFIAFARQGFKGEELSMLAEYSTLLGNISDLSVDESASILTAGLKAFNMETERGIHIVNALNEVDNNYSITTKQLAESMQRSAGTASVYGSSLERLIGYTTAIGEITRESGSVIGNSLKSIFSRITSVSGAIKTLDEIGISVKNSAGEMRAVDDILDDLGAQWQSLNAEQQQNIGLQVAGRYQLSRFLVLMNQYDQALQASETATNSVGSGYRENAEYLKSYEAQINMVKNSWTEAVLEMENSGLGDAMIVGLRTGLEFFKAITSIIDKVGLFPSVLGLATVAFLVFNKNAKAATMSNGAFIASLLRTPTAVNGLNATLVTSTALMRAKTVATNILTGSLRTLSGFLAGAFLPVAGFMALGAAISFVTTKISENVQKQKEINREIEEYKRQSFEAVTSHRDRLEELVSTYKKLEKARETEEWDSEKEDEYLSVQQELIELLPGSIKLIDGKGVAHAKTAEEIEKEIVKIDDLIKKQQELDLANEKDTYKEKIKEMREYQNAIRDAEGVLSRSIASETAKGKSLDTINAEKIAAEIAITINQSNLATSVNEIRNELVNNIKVGLSQAGAEIAKPLEDSLNNAISQINIEGLDEVALTKLRKSLTNLSKDIGEAFNSGDVEAFDGLIESFKFILVEAGLTEKEIAKLVPTFNEVKTATENYEQAMAEGAKVTDEFGDSVDGLGDSAEETSEKLYKPKNAIEELTGISSELLSDVDNLIFAFESLSSRTVLTAEETERLASTQDELLAMFPQLSSGSMDLIERYEHLSSSMRGSTVASDELAEIEKELLRIHPNLIKNGISRTSLIQDIIKNIKEETKANDILLAATVAASKGKLSSEETATLNKLEETNARIKIINTEIMALDKLRAAYDYFSEGAKKAAVDAATSVGMGSMLSAAMKASRMASQVGVESTRNSRLAELATETKNRTTYVDKLSQSEAVLANTTTASNKALADQIKNSKNATKAQKEAAKAMEQSTYIADKYKRALEELNLKIKEQQDIQANNPEHSSKYADALQKEIKLQQDKMNILKEQEKNLQAQIKAGKILNTGIITTKTGSDSSPTKLSGWSGQITSQFGRRFHPIDKVWRNHDGIDIAGKNGTRVDSNVSGTVTFAGNKGNGFGNYVAIKDASGNTNIYAHLEKVLVKAGQSIAQGVALGTIGSTGKSTGNHLHYQVNDSSGKPINPTSYVDAARKGISTASKEAAQVLADIDNAQSELIALQGQILDQENLLNSLILKNINTQLATFDNKRAIYQRILDYEAEKIKTLDLTSERYIKTLERNTMYLEKKQATNKRELEYLDQVIKKGGLSGNALEEMKIRAEELTAEMLALGVSIQELSADKIDTIMKRFDEGIEDITYSLERSKLIQEAYEEGTLDYNNEVKYQIELIKEHQQEIVNKRNELQKLILTENIGTERAKEYGRQIQQLSLEYWQLENSARNANKALEDSNKAMADNLANTLIDSLKSVISERRDAHMRQLESEMDSENQRHEIALANIDREMDAEKERHKQVQDYYDYQIEMEEKSHKKKMDNLKKQLRDFERYIQSQIEGIDRVENTRTYEKDIEKLQKEKNEIQRMLNELAGDNSYEAKAKRDELNKRLEEVDDQLFERRNAREIELRKENYDDLLEKEKLRIEQIEENDTKLHEQKLDDLKELKKREDELHDNNMKNLENRKREEDATHKARVNNINELKKYWTQFYEDQLNNEREFARIREEIVKGNLDALGEEFQRYVDEMIATMPELENTMNGTMQAVGTAVRQNLIDNLREALRLMNEFNMKSNTSRPVSSPSIGSGGSSGGSSSSGSSNRGLSSADLNVLTGKFLNDRLATTENNSGRKATIKDKGHSLADAGRASGSTISASQGFDSVVSGLSKEEQRQLGEYLKNNATKHVSSDYLKDYIRDYANRLINSSARFDTGGYTGKFSGGKLATLDPEELILNKKDTKTFARTMDILDRVFNLINPIKVPTVTPPTLVPNTGQGNIEINFNVDKMTGDAKDVNKFTQQLSRSLKRERGIR